MTISTPPRINSVAAAPQTAGLGHRLAARHEEEAHGQHDGELADLLERWAPARRRTRARILVDNPAELYGFARGAVWRFESCLPNRCHYVSMRSRFSVIRAMTRRNCASSAGSMPSAALIVHALRDLQEPVAQPPRLRRQMNPGDPPVVGAAHAADQARLLHAAQRDDRGRLHHADARAQFALRQPVLLPQHAQEIPLAAGDAVRRDAPLQQPLERAVGVAHQIAQAAAERKIDRMTARTCSPLSVFRRIAMRVPCGMARVDRRRPGCE